MKRRGETTVVDACCAYQNVKAASKRPEGIAATDARCVYLADAERDCLAYGVASALCRQPSRKGCAAIIQNRDSVQRALCSCGLSPEVCEALFGELERLSKDASACNAQAAEYVRLFRGIIPGKWSRPAYESVYVASSFEDRAEVMREVNELYGKAEIEVIESDAPDFIAIEFDAIRFLSERICEEPENSFDIKECRQLIRERVSAWVPLFCCEMKRSTHSLFFCLVADILTAVAKNGASTFLEK